MGVNLVRQLDFDARFLVAAAEVFHRLVLAALHGVHVRENQLEVDRLDVAGGVDRAINVDDVLVLEAAHDVDNRVHLADVAQKLVAQPFAVARAFHQTRNVHKLDGRGCNLLRVIHFAQHVQTVVRHHDNARVRLDGAERIVGRLCASLRDGINQGAFADIGQTDNA